jgi:hypothetical protein
MQRIYPTLKVGLGQPEAHNLIAVFKELHVYACRVIRATAETMITFFLQPRIFDFSHTLLYYSIFALN